MAHQKRRDGPLDIPDEIEPIRQLAIKYDRLLADDAELLAAPIDLQPDVPIPLPLGCQMNIFDR
jgi:hypothetical protein